MDWLDSIGSQWMIGPGLSRLLASLLALLAWYALYRLLRRILRRAFDARAGRHRANPRTARALQRGMHVLALLLLALLQLEIWGVSVSGLWSGVLSVFAIVGIGLLAAWSLLSNATASVFLSVWRPYRRGDHLTMVPDEMEGTIIEQNMLFTVLRCSDNDEIVIPNSMLFQRMVRVRRGGGGGAGVVEEWNPQ